jgi:glycosyltransferase involved in cell wall biosynthesis
LSRILAVIPNDKIKDYIKQGLTPNWLESYFNPGKFFEKVYLLSPLEESCRDFCGMEIVNVNESNFKKYLKKFKVDLVRAYGGNWTADFACSHKAREVPVIVSIHDKRDSFISVAVSSADYIFCTSEIVRKVALKKFRHPEKAFVVPNRIDLNVMKPIKKSDLAELEKKFLQKYNILHIGRKSEEKNLETVIKALKILGGQYGLIAIGSGEEKPYIELAKSLKVATRVYFIHHIDNLELPKYYSFCDCMCTPSLWEGFGIVFIEALACEALVVTSDIAPMNEYIQDSYNGVLIKNFTDPQSLAEKVKLVCENDNLRNKIKVNTRKSVEKFSKDKIDSLEVEYYKRILESAKKPTELLIFNRIINFFK